MVKNLVDSDTRPSHDNWLTMHETIRLMVILFMLFAFLRYNIFIYTEWMLSRMGKLCPNIIRVYGRSIESIDFPIPGRTFLSKRSTRNQTADKSLKSVTLHHLIRRKGNKHAKDINEFDNLFRDSNYALQPDNVRKYLHFVREASIEEIRKYDVIICTTAVGSNPKVLKATNVHQVKF